jgi:ABC-2 type transport system permease protein
LNARAGLNAKAGRQARPGVLSRTRAALGLYLKLLGSSARAKMQYRFDFLASTTIQTTMGLYDFLLVAVILWRFKTVAGWDIYEVGLVYASARIGYGAYRMICNELERFEHYIVTGEFDSILIRPYPTLFVLLSRDFDFTRVTWMVQGAALLTPCAAPLITKGTLNLAGLFGVMLTCVWSFLLHAAVALGTAAAAFWIVRIEELQVFTLNATSTATLYPLDIYPGWLRAVLLYVIPLGMGNYVPIRYLLGKGGSILSLFLPPVVAVCSLLVAYRLWRWGEANYHSTGS